MRWAVSAVAITWDRGIVWEGFFEQLTKIDGDSGAKRILMEYEDSIMKIPAQFAGQEADVDCREDIAHVEKIYVAVAQ